MTRENFKSEEGGVVGWVYNHEGLFCNFKELGGTICYSDAGSQGLEFTRMPQINWTLYKKVLKAQNFKIKISRQNLYC